MPFSQLTLIRHGKSVWNIQNRFTGWVDVPLSEAGITEAQNAGKAILSAGITHYDIAFSSYLQRAINTTWLVLQEMDLMWIPQQNDWRFNERHYGNLQGKNKAEAIEEYGEDQVFQWRRSYSTLPPLLETRQTIPDKRYNGVDMPTGESLESMLPRIIAAYEENIVPQLKQGKNVLLVAHGNTLRGLVKYLEKIEDDEINAVEIATGKPFYYEFNRSLEITAQWQTYPEKLI